MVIGWLILMVDGYGHEMEFWKYHEQKYLIIFRVILAIETNETDFMKPLRLLIMTYY